MFGRKKRKEKRAEERQRRREEEAAAYEKFMDEVKDSEDEENLDQVDQGERESAEASTEKTPSEEVGSEDVSEVDISDQAVTGESRSDEKFSDETPSDQAVSEDVSEVDISDQVDLKDASEDGPSEELENGESLEHDSAEDASHRAENGQTSKDEDSIEDASLEAGLAHEAIEDDSPEDASSVNAAPEDASLEGSELGEASEDKTDDDESLEEESVSELREDDDLDYEEDIDYTDYYEEDAVPMKKPLWKRFFGAIFSVIKNIFILIISLLLIGFVFIYLAIFVGTNRYSVEYADLINEAAETYNVDPYLIAGIVRTESGYDPEAVSQDGAKGLMQIMPKTAEWASQQLGIEYKPKDLMDPAYNINMGTFYISYLIQHFQNKDLAIAAYNTGQTNVENWLEEGIITWEQDTLKNIPYEETRNYVERVNRAEKIYRVFYPEGLINTGPENDFALALDNLKNLIDWSIERTRVPEATTQAE